jgi:hypothetical protein
MHKKENGQTVQFKVIDNISKMTPQDWYIDFKFIYILFLYMVTKIIFHFIFIGIEL